MNEAKILFTPSSVNWTRRFGKIHLSNEINWHGATFHSLSKQTGEKKISPIRSNERMIQHFLECSKNLNALNVMPIVIQVFNYLDWLTVNSTRMKWNHFHLSDDLARQNVADKKN